MAPAHSPCGRLHVNYIHRCQYYLRLWLMTREHSSTAGKCTCVVSILTILHHCGCEELILIIVKYCANVEYSYLDSP